MKRRGIEIAVGVAVLGMAGAGLAGATAVHAPRIWHSADGAVTLTRPVAARVTTSSAPLGSLMAPGWRLLWNGSAPTPGRIVVRLTLPVVPATGVGQRTEALQIGTSRAPSALRDCLAGGLGGGSSQRLAPRVINGVRFAVWRSGDAGMSQSIDATDLRAIVGGTCYAVARIGYGVSAADSDPGVRLRQADGAKMLDAALSSLRIASKLR